MLLRPTSPAAHTQSFELFKRMAEKCVIASISNKVFRPTNAYSQTEDDVNVEE